LERVGRSVSFFFSHRFTILWLWIINRWSVFPSYISVSFIRSRVETGIEAKHKNDNKTRKEESLQGDAPTQGEILLWSRLKSRHSESTLHSTRGRVRVEIPTPQGASGAFFVSHRFTILWLWIINRWSVFPSYISVSFIRVEYSGKPSFYGWAQNQRIVCNRFRIMRDGSHYWSFFVHQRLLRHFERDILALAIRGSSATWMQHLRQVMPPLGYGWTLEQAQILAMCFLYCLFLSQVEVESSNTEAEQQGEKSEVERNREED
jgi:hypothetical protein